MSDGLWFVGVVILVVGMSYVEHLEHVDCRDRGGTVVEGFWSDSCEGAK